MGADLRIACGKSCTADRAGSGATPAITGRFDVNYILGQQMAGGKQLTVVVDYTSKVEQEELVYQDLEYEQVSFDFI